MDTFEPKEGDLFLKRGKNGIFLIHGFFQSPEEFKQITEKLAENNITVYCPCLPSYSNHKNRPILEFLNIDINIWQKEIEESFLKFQKTVGKIYVGGNSLGANLALILASKYPADGIFSLGAAAYFSHSLRVAQKIGPFLVRLFVDEDNIPFFQINQRIPIFEITELFDKTKKVLPSITRPILIVHSKHDKMILPKSAKYIYKNIGSKDKKLIFLENKQKNGHGLTTENFSIQVAEEIIKFINPKIES